MTIDDKDLIKYIAELGAASEVELQAKTLQPLRELREQLKHLEDQGVLRRKPGVFRQTGAGDALELTPEGYKSVR